MAMSLSILTRRLGAIAITRSSIINTIPASCRAAIGNQLITPGTTTGVRYISKKKKKVRQKARALAASVEEKPKITQVNTQHEEWVKFQQSISVSGFDTGQTLSIIKDQTSRRGGQKLTKRKERERLALLGRSHADEDDLGPNDVPALRYSEEETERLLAQAYAALPERTGKRGTRNLKRQKIRWAAKRKRDRKVKEWRVAAHFRRMEKRSLRVRQVKEMKEMAVGVRERERAYQDKVMEDWARMVVGGEKLWDEEFQHAWSFGKKEKESK